MSNNMMNSLGLKMVAGVAIAGTVTLAMGSSAEAAVIGRVDFGGSADLNTTSIDFTGAGATASNGAADGTIFQFSSTGNFNSVLAAFPNIVGAIKDLPTLSSATPGSPLANFITFTGNPQLSFTLTNFVLANPNLYTFKGFFTDGTLGKGQIAFVDPILNNMADIRGYSGKLEAVAVPTPALLPGLLGVGLAALRKKRQAEAANA